MPRHCKSILICSELLHCKSIPCNSIANRLSSMRCHSPLRFAVATRFCSMLCRCLSKLHLASIAIAFPSFSLPFHCSSEPCFAMPLHFHALLSHAFANFLNSLHCLCCTVQSHTLPLPRFSLKSCAFCGANHVVSMQFHCTQSRTS